MSIRFGTNPIGWSNDDMPELGGDTPLDECLSEARQAGFEGIGNKFPREPAALAQVLSAHGLEYAEMGYANLRRFAKEAGLIAA